MYKLHVTITTIICYNDHSTCTYHFINFAFTQFSIRNTLCIHIIAKYKEVILIYGCYVEVVFNFVAKVPSNAIWY